VKCQDCGNTFRTDKPPKQRRAEEDERRYGESDSSSLYTDAALHQMMDDLVGGAPASSNGSGRAGKVFGFLILIVAGLGIGVWLFR
jgi:hypothetical protein